MGLYYYYDEHRAHASAYNENGHEQYAKIHVLHAKQLSFDAMNLTSRDTDPMHEMEGELERQVNRAQHSQGNNNSGDDRIITREANMDADLDDVLNICKIVDGMFMLLCLSLAVLK